MQFSTADEASLLIDNGPCDLCSRHIDERYPQFQRFFFCLKYDNNNNKDIKLLLKDKRLLREFLFRGHKAHTMDYNT